MPPRLLAVLATFICSGCARYVIGSSAHGAQPKAGAGAVLTTADGKVISAGRVRCHGGVLSARALCVRGGSIAEDQGPTDYSSTLQDQSQPWWTDGRKASRSGGGGVGSFFAAADKQRKRGRRAAKKAINLAPSANTNSLPWSAPSSSSVDSLSPTGWAALLALPLAILAGKLKDTANNSRGNSSGAASTRQVKAPVVKARKPAKPKPTREAKAKRAPPAPKPSPKAQPTPVSETIGAVVANNGGKGKGKGKRGNDGGVISSLVGKMIPGNPYLRGVAIIALAVLGSGGLYTLKSENLLRAAWPLTFVDPWQVLTAASLGINIVAVGSAGRLDGKGEKSSPQPTRFFTPAGWAFVIWAPIFLGEIIFAGFQLLPLMSIRGSWWLSDISPWFAGAMLFQTLWCFSFRPWARDNGLIWLPALLLGAVPVALGAGVHAVLREAWFAGDMTVLQYILIHVPLSLHFGWASCAALVSLNGFFASIAALSNGFKLGASLCSIAAAAVLGVGVTLLREDPVYAAVVAWALWAVASPAGWDELRGRVSPSAIRAQQGVAKAGAAIAAAAAGSLVGLSLKDAITGAKGGEYDGEY